MPAPGSPLRRKCILVFSRSPAGSGGKRPLFLFFFFFCGERSASYPSFRNSEVESETSSVQNGEGKALSPEAPSQGRRIHGEHCTWRYAPKVLLRVGGTSPPVHSDRWIAPNTYCNHLDYSVEKCRLSFFNTLTQSAWRHKYQFM